MCFVFTCVCLCLCVSVLLTSMFQYANKSLFNEFELWMFPFCMHLDVSFFHWFLFEELVRILRDLYFSIKYFCVYYHITEYTCVNEDLRKISILWPVLSLSILHHSTKKRHARASNKYMLINRSKELRLMRLIHFIIWIKFYLDTTSYKYVLLIQANWLPVA